MLDTPENLTITVRDMGPGIPVEMREIIFQQGFSTKGSANCGLGLYLVKRYVNMGGGSILIQDANGGGVIFNINIPKEQGSQKKPS